MHSPIIILHIIALSPSVGAYNIVPMCKARAEL